MLSDTLFKFENLTKRPLKYLEGDNDTAAKIKYSLKEVYDYVLKRSNNTKNCTKILPELIIENFDEEQIWQELELHNNLKYEESFSSVTNLLVCKEKLSFHVSKNNDNSDGNYESDNIEGKLKDEETKLETRLNENELEEEKPFIKEAVKRKRKTSVVDDRFFKLEDLEEFLEKQDKAHERNRSVDLEIEAINYFEDNSSNNETDEEVFYNDFFDAPDDVEDYRSPQGDKCNYSDNEVDNPKRVKKLRFDLPSSENSDGASSSDENKFKDSNDHPKSSFQLRQERLQSRIKKLEENALAEKPWQLTGEVSAQNRPPNSLLEEVLEYDLTRRPAPVITEQTTFKLEDIIRQRIKDRVWDDVERKIKPVLAPNEYKKQIVLDQEKSKLSLAQVYEQEYLKKKEALSSDLNDKPEEEEESQEHRVIRSMMSSLFAKLDALSNFHFTPKMIIPEVKIVSNLPAITMEEVAPVSTTDATLLAPEEIKAKQKGNLIGSAERTKTDKKREIRKKKRKLGMQKKREEEIVKKLNPGLGNKYSKEKTLESLKQIRNSKNLTLEDGTKGSVIRSSTAFFSRLQDEKSTGKNINKMKKNKQELCIKKIKL